MLKTILRWINRLLWTVLVTVLVLVASYVSVGRYYISYVELYQQQLLQHFVQFTGLPLTADRLYGRWLQLSPILTIENLELYVSDASAVNGGSLDGNGPEGDDSEGKGPVLTIKNISFQIDPVKSLLNFCP